MLFLSNTERKHLRELLQTKADDAAPMDGWHIDSDAHLVFEALHVLTNGNAARLYAMLHPHGHKSHPDANGGRTLLMMQKIEEYGSAGCAHEGTV